MLRLIGLLLVLNIVYSCNTSGETIKNSEGGKQKELTYLALGDSYTIGEKVDRDQAWPNQLAEALENDGISMAPVKIIAKTGWRSDELLEAMTTKLQKDKQFDLVSLSIGVNNQYQGKSIDVFRKEFRTLLKKAISHCKHGRENVFVVSIPNYGVTPFGKSKQPEKITRELKEYNAVCKAIAEEYEVDFYNITPISLQAENDQTLVASDGLHPSAKMYSLWIKKIKAPILDKLND